MRLAETASLRRACAGCRKLTDVCLASLLAEALHARPPPDGALPAFQRRFSDA